MHQYDLTNEEDLRLRFSIMLPFKKQSLYEYFCDLPLEQLKVYPKRGYRWWMGKVARSPDALALRDYILHWRLAALDFRQKYSKKYLEKLSYNELRFFLDIYIDQVPFWAYEAPVSAAAKLLLNWENDAVAH